MKRLLFILSIIVIPFAVCGQEGSPRVHALFGNCIPNPSSPEASSMVCYGNETANLYSGSFSMSIPVYIYEDDDFTVPITLEYTTTGYKPNMSTGTTGLGWNLSAGGAITREVRGIMDDMSNGAELYSYHLKWAGDNSVMSSYLTPAVSGYAHFNLLDTYNTGTHHDDILYSDKAGEEYMPVIMSNDGTTAYETTPDIFHFSVPGNHGSFALQPLGGYVFFNTDGPSKLYELEYIMGDYGITSFSITDPDKYEYSFGYLEWAHSLSDAGSDSDIETPGSWRLTSITAPNGRQVNFVYGEYSYSVSCSPTQIIDVDRKVAEDELSGLNKIDDMASYSATFVSMTDVRCGCLTGISVDGAMFNAVLSYGHKAKEGGFYKDIYKKLENINIYNSDNELVKSCNLSYCINDNDYYTTTEDGITFLNRVDLSGVGAYTFEYNRMDQTAPPLNTSKTDWYGYYNPLVASLAPTMSQARLGNSYLTEMRQANTEACMYGVMTGISYPTGGRSVLEYESNRYGEDLTGIDTESVNAVTSGVRVSSIRVYDESDTETVRRTFSYTDEDGRPSGRLLWRPIIYCKYDGSSSSFKHINRETVSTASDFPFGKNPHVEYLHVKETISSPSDPSELSTIRYGFLSARYPVGLGSASSFMTGYEDESSFRYDWTIDETTEDEFHRLFVGEPSNFYGRPVSKVEYKGATSQIVNMENNTYGYCDAGNLVSTQSSIGYRYNHILGLQYPYLRNRTVRTYGDKGGLIAESSVTTSIDGEFRINSVVATDSRGLNVESCYSYHPVIRSYVTEVKTLRGGFVTSLVKYDYKHLSGDHYAPLSMHTAKIDALRTDLSGISSYVTEFTINIHDSWGRPLKMTDKSGRVTDITWVGSNPSSLSNTVGGHVLMTVYGWKPLVGMTGKTLPSGRSTSYEYDNTGRLVLVRDGKGLPVSGYNYNIVTEL